MKPLKNTEFLSPQNPQDVVRAVELLEAGGLVALPTETVYGLAARADSADAVAAIFAAKGRPSDHPLIVHISSADQLASWAQEIPDDAFRLAEHFWPGPLTLLLNKAPHVSSVVTGGKATIALRVPDHTLFSQIFALSKLAFAAPSANLFKELSPVNATQVLDKLGGKIDGILDGGQCEVGLESTIVDLTQHPYTVLRSGPISLRKLREVLGAQVQYQQQHNVSVPGNVKEHYQPRTPFFLVNHDEMAELLTAGSNDQACLYFAEGMPASRHVGQISMPAKKVDFARIMYQTLHDLDSKSYRQIFCQRPPVNDEWADVNDRLSKAASKP